MLPESAEVPRIMSASVAPVFLITGIAALLSIMVLRYGRVIDRIRTLLRDGPKLFMRELDHEHLNRELKTLYTRARLLRLTIILEVVSIFCVTITIFSLFSSLSFGFNFHLLPVIFFIASLFFLMVGLILFIRDFALSLGGIEYDMKAKSNVDISKNVT